ncbi:MAG: ABC transporter ATP-binding protein [Nanoarchaeota archaeon]|jgi:branched-chain amino acid transport system ATP-binding protein|nr:ABC transporter ATP-binding protein [Nanoarchaeota archaeon]
MTEEKMKKEDNMIELKNIKAGYGKFEVLHGMNMEIPRGKITAIIGPNGSGKSTVIKSIYNIADVYSGKVLLNDEDITNLQAHELIRHGVAYIPQGKRIFEELTVLENLELGAEFINDKELCETRIKEVFRKYPVLEKRQKKLAYGLSGGERQQLALGRALIQKPEVIIMDEPSIGLSPILQKDLFLMIQELRDEGLTILIVEQNAKKAIEIADKTYILENKKIREVYLGGY